MMLLLDIGNTRMAWATLDGTATRFQGVLDHTGDGLSGRLDEAWSGLAVPQRILVSNVAGVDIATALSDWTSSRWQLLPEMVTALDAGYGVTNAYQEPSRLGTDRWAALVAARDRFPGSVCIIDCGTAITIDAISGDGEHLGGLIVPGLTLMQRALLENTNIEYQGQPAGMENVSLLARDTGGGVMGGSLYAVIALIDRVAADLGSELGPDMVCVITGGDAEHVLPLLSGDFKYIPDLVLQGLAVIAGHEDGGKAPQ